MSSYCCPTCDDLFMASASLYSHHKNKHNQELIGKVEKYRFVPKLKKNQTKEEVNSVQNNKSRKIVSTIASFGNEGTSEEDSEEEADQDSDQESDKKKNYKLKEEQYSRLQKVYKSNSITNSKQIESDSEDQSQDLHIKKKIVKPKHVALKQESSEEDSDANNKKIVKPKHIARKQESSDSSSSESEKEIKKSQPKNNNGIKAERNSAGMIECPQCDASFDSFKACNQHINSKHKVKIEPKPVKKPLKFVKKDESDNSSGDDFTHKNKNLNSSFIKKTLQSQPKSKVVTSSESESEPTKNDSIHNIQPVVVEFSKSKDGEVPKNFFQNSSSEESESDFEVAPKKSCLTSKTSITKTCSYRCPTCHTNCATSDLLIKHSILKHDNEIVGPISRYQVKAESSFNRPKVTALRAIVRESSESEATSSSSSEDDFVKRHSMVKAPIRAVENNQIENIKTRVKSFEPPKEITAILPATVKVLKKNDQGLIECTESGCAVTFTLFKDARVHVSSHKNESSNDLNKDLKRKAPIEDLLSDKKKKIEALVKPDISSIDIEVANGKIKVTDISTNSEKLIPSKAYQVISPSFTTINSNDTLTLPLVASAKPTYNPSSSFLSAMEINPSIDLVIPSPSPVPVVSSISQKKSMEEQFKEFQEFQWKQQEDFKKALEAMATKNKPEVPKVSSFEELAVKALEAKFMAQLDAEKEKNRELELKARESKLEEEKRLREFELLSKIKFMEDEKKLEDSIRKEIEEKLKMTQLEKEAEVKKLQDLLFKKNAEEIILKKKQELEEIKRKTTADIELKKLELEKKRQADLLYQVEAEAKVREQLVLENNRKEELAIAKQFCKENMELENRDSLSADQEKLLKDFLNSNDIVEVPDLRFDIDSAKDNYSKSLSYDSIIVEDEETLLAAVTNLKSRNVISVSYAGHNIDRSGKLSLLSIASQKYRFIFDFIALGSSIFEKGLKDILESTAIVKLFYDVRRISDLLFHQFNVKLKMVFDIQIIEFARRRQSENATNFISLSECLSKYLPDVASSQNITPTTQKENLAKFSANNGAVYYQRPLTAEVLLFATNESIFLRYLASIIQNANILNYDPLNLKFLKLSWIYSARNVCIVRDSNNPSVSNDSLFQKMHMTAPSSFQ